jgi:hypothetical protein
MDLILAPLFQLTLHMLRINKILLSLIVCLLTSFQAVYLIADNRPDLFPTSGIHITSQIPIFNTGRQENTMEFPSIVCVPIEAVPVDFRKNDHRCITIFLHEPGQSNYLQLRKDYLSHNADIKPGLETTDIGYPFHSFW